MRLTRTTAWVGGAVLLALVVSTATWLLLVSPRQQVATDLRDQAASTSAQNDALAAQVRRLEVELGDVPQTRAEVADLREQVPTDADLPTLLRQVSDLAVIAGVELTGVTPLEPGATALPGAAAAPVEAGATTTTPGAVPGLQVVPVTITATAGFAQAQELLRLVQVDLPRAVLVRSVSLGGGGEDGDLQVTITADAFALPTTPQEEQLAAVAGQSGTTQSGTAGSAATTPPATAGPAAPESPAPTTTEAPVPATTSAPLAAAAPPTLEETL